jgi:hypothetical protein
MRNSYPKEPLISHDVPVYPWKTKATDLFTWNNQEYLLVADYYSRYFEVEKLYKTTSPAVIEKMKAMFSRVQDNPSDHWILTFTDESQVEIYSTSRTRRAETQGTCTSSRNDGGGERNTESITTTVLSLYHHLPLETA